MRTISENKCFGGMQGVYAHASEATGTEMTFGLFLPAEAEDRPVPVEVQQPADAPVPVEEQH